MSHKVLMRKGHQLVGLIGMSVVKRPGTVILAKKASWSLYRLMAIVGVKVLSVITLMP